MDAHAVRMIARDVTSAAVGSLQGEVAEVYAQLAKVEQRLESMEGTGQSAQLDRLEPQLAGLQQLAAKAAETGARLDRIEAQLTGLQQLAAKAAAQPAPAPQPAPPPMPAAPQPSPAPPAVAPTRTPAPAVVTSAPAQTPAPAVVAAAPATPSPAPVAAAPVAAAPLAATPSFVPRPRDIEVDLDDLSDLPFVSGAQRKRRVFIGVLIVLLGIVASFVVFAIISQSNHHG